MTSMVQKNTFPKIAIISLDPRIGGGVLSSVKQLYHFLDNNNYEPTIFFLDFSKEHAMSLKRFKFNTTDSSFLYQNMRCLGIGAKYAFWEPFHYSNTISSWTALDSYDLIFVSSGTPFAAHPAVLKNKKFILWVATPFWDDRKTRLSEESFLAKILGYLSKPFLAKIEKQILEKASIILPMSHYAKDEFQKILAYNKHMDVCGYPINIEADYPKDYSKKIILAVGRFTDPRKNISMLLKTWALIENADSEACLVIIGNVTPAIEKFISKHPRIFLVKEASNDIRDQWYKHASLLIITSTQEGLGIVGLEALNFSTPIFSTDCFGVRDFVIHQKTGMLCPLNNHVRMAQLVTTAISQPSLLKKLGEYGKIFLKANYCSSKILKQWQRNIDLLLNYKATTADAESSVKTQMPSYNQIIATQSKQKEPKNRPHKNL